VISLGDNASLIDAVDCQRVSTGSVVLRDCERPAIDRHRVEHGVGGVLFGHAQTNRACSPFIPEAVAA
jgi:hypothetical protein